MRSERPGYARGGSVQVNGELAAQVNIRKVIDIQLGNFQSVTDKDGRCGNSRMRRDPQRVHSVVTQLEGSGLAVLNERQTRALFVDAVRAERNGLQVPVFACRLYLRLLKL